MLRPSSALVTVLLAVATGCGQEAASDRGSDPASPSTQSSSSDVAWTQVAIVSGTAAGGSTGATLVRLDTPAALDAFVAQFERPRLGDDVRRAVEAADVPDGQVVAGAVVSIGCDVPPGVTLSTKEALRVVPDQAATPLRECLAPVTSVAVLTVDASLLSGG
jgi:surface antigen